MGAGGGDEEAERKAQVAEAWAEAAAGGKKSGSSSKNDSAVVDGKFSSSNSSWSPSSLVSPHYRALLERLDILQHEKSGNPAGRLTWQVRQRGGQGEPFYRDPDAFEMGLQKWIDWGHVMFEEKWGRGGCDLRDAGLGEEDAWKVIKGWEKDAELVDP